MSAFSIHDIAAKLRSLPPEKRRLLRLRLFDMQENGDLSRDLIIPVSRSEPLTLALAQRRLWFLHQMEPLSLSYNLPMVVSLEGPLDLALLRRSAGQLVHRHEALRTAFDARDGNPEVRVHHQLELAVPVVDLRALPDDERDREQRRLVKATVGLPFRLGQAPLIRFVLLRRAEQETVLALTQHHIITDAVSISLLVQELSSLYAAQRQGRPSPLKPLAIQYADFAAWQSTWLTPEAQTEQLQYWREQLAGAPPLELPTDRPRPPMATNRGGKLELWLGPDTARPLGELARKHQASLFMVLLAAYAALLARITGRNDLVLGTPVAGRSLPVLETLLGMFVNTLVLRLQVRDGAGFEQVLEEARKVTLGALSNQDIPFEQLVEELVEARDPSRNPLFQAFFSHHSQPPQAPGSGTRELRIRPVPLDSDTTLVDLTLETTEAGGGVQMGLSYNTDLLDRSTALRWLRQLQRLLSGLAQDPDASLSSLLAPSPAQAQQLLLEWQGQPADAAQWSGRAVVSRLSAQAQQRPGAVALRGTGQWFASVATPSADAQRELQVGFELSYAELATMADGVTEQLRRQGAGADAVVAVQVPRSPQLVATLWGVLRSGAAYLPLDPELPPARRSFMIEDSGARWLVLAGAAEELQLGEQVQVLPLQAVGLGADVGTALAEETESAGPSAEADLAASVPIAPEQLAYVIYTSGSSGQPKGVGVSHGALANLISWHLRAFGLGPDDRGTMLAGLGFDASVWEIWPALAAGASLYIPSDEQRLQPGELLQTLAQENVGVSFLPTPLLEAALLEEATLARLGMLGSSPATSLRLLLTGGDRLRRRPPATLRPGLVNCYGPTENTVVATYGTVRRAGGPAALGLPSIGRPVDGVWATVVDPGQKPCGIGVPGELVLGGDSLARGYLGRPALTADRFRPDGVWAQPGLARHGARLYHTGDRVRTMADGRLEFLERLDSQVKVRGFRIELGEIEAAVTEHSKVAEAIVVLDRRGGHEGLVAYCVPDQPVGEEPEAVHALESTLHRDLGQRLPEYMVPAAFVFLASLPLNANGKVDRKRLPAPSWSPDTASYVAPEGEMEEQVAAVFSEVLGLDRVGAAEDFFRLGGHSLLATQAVSRLAKLTELSLDLQDFFRGPTVRELAALLSERSAGGGAEGVVPPLVPPLVPQSGDGQYPVSFAQERLWLVDRLQPGSAAYNITAAVELEGELQPSLLARALTHIVERHESLRTTFRATTQGPVQVIAEPGRGNAVLPRVDLLELGDQADELARQIVAKQAARPFDLELGPLLRGLLLTVAPQRHILLLVMHHIVSDGWSMGVLVQEVSKTYGHLVRDEEPALTPLPVQYPDFALWQRRWLGKGELERQLAYWQDHLQGAPTLLELPWDRPRPALASQRGATLDVWLGAEAAGKLRLLCEQEDSTLFMGLLACFASYLGRWSGQEDLLIGSPIAGRNRPELEGLIGFFINTLVMRTRLSPGLTARQLMQQTREECVAAFAHQEMPFERLVEVLETGRDLSRSPLYQVVLVLQNAPPGEAEELPGLSLDSLPAETGATKFDLTLAATELGDRLALSLEYAVDLFDRSTMHRLACGLEHWMTTMASQPDEVLTQLAALRPAEEQQLVREWGQQPRPYERQGGIYQLFAEQAVRTPDAVALVGADGLHLSYATLQGEALALAGNLGDLEREEGVGLALQRGPELIIASLAVLAAGGAYVPLDPDYPRERLQLMAAASGLKLVLVSPSLRSELGGLGKRQLVLEAGQPWSLDAEPRAASPAATDQAVADQLAYVMFTSGSTGTPKGVAVPQRAVLRLVRNSPFMQLGPETTMAQLAPTSFDAATLEIWGPLLNGGRLVLPPAEKLTPNLVGGLARRERLSDMWLTSALFHFMVDEQPEDLLTVGHILTGGDAVSAAHLRRFFLAGYEGQISNGYGPTENTTFTTTGAVRSAHELGSSVPIGRPIANSTVRVLDPQLRPVPMGGPGELLTGGDGLARAYLGHPAWTAERFVPDPQATLPGQRLYRTGDKVRFLNDGRLDFLGRMDRQVKIRGFRIEPGEIESALLALGGLQQAAVIAREGRPGDKMLVAYLVAGGTEPDSRDLDTALQKQLPEHMLPQAYVFLEAMPRTANGKLDRAALPDPQVDLPTGRPPHGPVEEIVAATFAEVLGTSCQDAERSFFELGGHSLLAAQVCARLERALDKDVPLGLLFSAPSVADLAAALDRNDGAGTAKPWSTLQAIEPDAGPVEAPLSFSQKRLWFIDRLEPGLATYNVPMSLALVGALDTRALELALGDVVRRHAVLRTVYTQTGGASKAEPVQARAVQGEAVQKVLPAAGLHLPRVDLRALPVNACRLEARRLATEEVARPFDLERGPVLRVLLLHLAPAEGETDRESARHELLATVHHIASDAWSMGILSRELGVAYAARRAGHAPRLPALAVQYADFARWQREHLGEEALASDLAWWKQQLADLPPVLELPTDRPRPVVASYRGATVQSAVGPVLGELRQLALAEGATLYMALLALFQALLARLSGSRDIPVGSPVAGRLRPELENLIGFFTNTLVLRGDLEGQPSLRELLRRTRAVTLEAYVRQSLPFEQLVEALAPQRSLSHSPLFQVLLSLDNASNRPGTGLKLEGLRLGASEGGEWSTSKFDLSLFTWERQGSSPVDAGLDLSLEFARDLYDRSTAQRLLTRFCRLLASAVEEPERPLESLSWLSPAEQHQSSVEMAEGPGASQDPALGLCARFARTLKRQPDGVAVSGNGAHLSYGELHRRAALVARRLQARGVGPDQVVGVWARREVETSIAVLAVLRSGAAYLPLDPSYPAERLAFMVADAGAEHLLHGGGTIDLPLVAHRWSVEELCSEQVGAPNNGSEPWRDDPEALAYVIYTSGSTGRPKGVGMSRGAMAQLLAWQARDLRGPRAARTLQFAALSFDVSFQELATTWAYGGTLVLVDEETRRDGRALLAHLAQERVERLFLPFVALEHLAETSLAQGQSGDQRPTLALRELITAGEQLRLSWSLRRWLEELHQVDLYNHYGPSETHVVSAWSLPQSGWAGDLPPIGRPIDGTRLDVLDPSGRPQGLGVPGELLIGGRSVGRGYLGRPALTAASFVPGPAVLDHTHGGQRRYRSGDLVRWLPSGDLEFLGRIDQQVKVRGFRVEPGEIESVLDRHPAVSAVAVTVREDAPGGRALVAYVVASEGEEVSTSTLRGVVSEQLPSHMVPSFWMVLESLPLTPSGKVDRRSLPAPQGQAEEVEPPRGPMEELVAGVYAEVLATQDSLTVGRQDDFFSLGGHSLKATQVVSRLEQITGVELSLRTLFQQPTVAGLAAWLEDAGRAEIGSRPPLVATVAHDAAGSAEPVPLSYAQERLWFLDRLQPGSPAYHLPNGVLLMGDLDIGALERAIGGVVQRHGALRTRFLEVDGEPRQQVMPMRSWALGRVDLSGLETAGQQQEAARWTATNHLLPFDLEQGKLLRTCLLHLGPEDGAGGSASHLLLINMHHIVSDGWSMGVFVGEVVSSYQALAAGEAPELPSLPLQYVDFAQWQRQMLEAGEAERQLAYWREELEGAPTALDLATDRPRPPVQSVRGNSLPLQLGPELSAELQQLARQEGATLFMVLMAGYAALLARESRQRDVLIGTPIANRNRQEIEGLVGFFVNTLVLRARLGERPSLRQLVAQMRERTLDAYAHQDLPFERLVEGLGLERDLSRPPLFQAMLVLQNTPQASAEPSGLQVKSLGGETQTTKFELTLGMEESPQGLVGGAEYASDLFDSTTVQRLLAGFRALLRAAVSEPDRPLEDLDLLARAQRHQLLLEWQGQAASGDALLVPTLVDEWARQQPEQLALRSEQGSQSYGELQADSARVAQSLVDRGATAESVVAVELERSPQLVVVLWGVLRAGAAYLPIDPSLPAERKRGMVEDAGALCWVRAGEPAAESPIAQLRPEDLLEDHGAGSEAWQDVEIQAQQLAYVIYTSGSTGRPKGVAVSHGALANLVAWHCRAFDLEPGQRSTQLAGLGFDASVWEIWPALASGGTLVLAPDEVRLSPSRLPAWLAEERIDRSFLPTPLLEAALVQNWPAPRPQLLLTGGDRLRTLPTADFEPAVANCYGPTENAVVATWGAVARQGSGTDVALETEGAASLLPSIGRAVDGCRVGVVDRQLRATALGVPGELVIGGHSLARGYLGQPASSAAAFVPDGLWGEPGARLYRSGDLVRTLADGRLDFLGRVDHQVKVRGFRIELGEIEQVLASHPDLQQVAVVLDGQGDKARLVSYVVVNEQEADAPAAMLDEAELRSWLGQQLPEYMLPAAFVLLEQLPLTPNGKVDRRNLPAPPSLVTSSDELETESQEPRDELERQLQELWQEVLEVEAVGLHQSFFDLGGHSLLLAKCQTLLKERLGREVPMVDLFRLPTVADLAEHLRGAPAPKRRQVELKERSRGDGAIAIVGLAGRFPGASSVEQFWQNLRAGKETVRFFSPEELREAGVDEATLSSPGFVPAASLLDDPEHFDAQLFAISPKEARLLDPQQRLFLECAWTALEDASCDPDQTTGPVGVYAGIGTSQYWLSVVSNPELAQGLDPLQLTLGNEKDFFATRVAYKLNLKGPSLDVQTACSTSLVATHLACQALQAGDCDLALAGGVSLSGYGPGGYTYQPGSVVSPDGHTRSFDSQAQGTVSGSGVGIVVLKRLEDALRDGDSIRAVIRGTAINNDGSDKVGFTAPSVAGQAEAIARAQAVAGVSPEQISYVEAHGSATPLGDPIEVTALNEVFAGHEGEVLLGAVKSNVGHLDAAAGVTGLIKTVMSLQHRQIPPTLHFEQLNPEIQPGPFRVVSELTEWPSPEGSEEPLRAGVSAFGLGGTNAHVVVEEAPRQETPEANATETVGREAQLLLLSGATSSAVQQLGQALAVQLEQEDDLDLADLAHSLRVGRRRLSQRRALVVTAKDDGRAALKDLQSGDWLQRSEERQQRAVAFLLPGVGDHYPQMGRDLYQSEPTFRAVVDQAHEQLQKEQGLDLLRALFPEQTLGQEGGKAGAGVDLRKLLGRSGGSAEASESGPLDSTELAQPAVFVVEMALAALWREWGVQPKALIGYSLGEYSAACLAGVFSFEEGLRLVAERARLIEGLPAGGMLAVPVAKEAVRDETDRGLGLADLFEAHPELAVAAHNGPDVTVLSGPIAALEAIEERLREMGQVFQRLSTGHAFHSPMMQPIVPAFRRILSQVKWKAPRLPYLSNVTGSWIDPEQARDPEHWVRHLCGTVRFTEGLENLLSDSSQVLLEVGPGQALSTAARQHPARQTEQVVLASLRDAREQLSDHRFLLSTVGRLWLAGGELDWQGFVQHEQRRRLPLPTYPFERQRYWAQPAGPGAMSLQATGSQAAAQGRVPQRNDVATWFNAPMWKATAPARPPGDLEGQHWLLVGSEQDALGEALEQQLRNTGASVQRAAAGHERDLRDVDTWRQLIDGISGLGQKSLQLVCLPGLLATVPTSTDLSGTQPTEALPTQAANEGSEQTLLPFLALGQTLASGVQNSTEDGKQGPQVTLHCLTRAGWDVLGGEPSDPIQALLLGAVLVLPREVPGLEARVIDLPAAVTDDPARHAATLGHLVAELASGIEGAADAEAGAAVEAARDDQLVALRGNRRWAQSMEPQSLVATELDDGLRPNGIYLITGGFGRMGQALAEAMARRAKPRLVLLGRTELPSRERWRDELSGREEQDPVARRIAQVQALESLGAEVHPVHGDVTDGRRMAEVLAWIRSELGGLHGVVHLAGVAGGGLLAQESPEGLARVLRPKVEGTLILSRLLNEIEAPDQDGEGVEFLFLASSLLGTLGVAGQLGLAAASAFLDAHAQAISGSGGLRTLALDWDGWQSPAMEAGITPQEGAEVFVRSLASTLPQLLASPQDLQALLAGRSQRAQGASEVASDRSARHARPELATPYVEPEGELEQDLAKIWLGLLGLDRVGAEDNFLELGGDSLMGLQVLARVREDLAVELEPQDLFAAPTVRSLALRIQDLRLAEEAEDLEDLEALLGSIEEMSDEDVLEQIDSRGQV